MKLIFLSAGLPLTKTYTTRPDGSIESSSYPHVYEFSSHEVSVSSLTQLKVALEAAAKRGECLLKGLVGRPLISESRAGATDSMKPTDWVCFDLDGATFPDTDAFMAAIGLGEIAYVRHYSASSGLKPGLRAHIYVELASAVLPVVLKQFLLWKNLTVPELAKGLNLTRTNASLRYPLDITTCQNDKLLYIAPPILGPGLTDPHPSDRITVVPRPISKWSVPTVPSIDSLRVMQQDKINELRKAVGLPTKKLTNSKAANGVEYVPNPGEAVVTGEKRERGFVYLNLNGGDSWAYYYPEDTPEFLYNFKGEPNYKLAELCPAYWSTLQQNTNSGKANSFGIIYLGVCDKKSGAYRKVTYDENTDTLVLDPARNKEQLKDFLKQHGQPVKDFVSDWKFTWDPKSNTTIDIPNKTINTFIPSEFMKMQAAAVGICPPMIKKVILHSLGGDEKCFDHVMNHFAFMIQFRTRSNVALVEFGVEGTGKGVTFHRILTRIFGEHNVVAKRMEELEGEFTGFMENKLLCLIDEVQVSRSVWHAKVTAKLKNLIVEPFISIRKMYQEAYMAPNYCNFIFASNSRDPVEVSRSDRRFTVAPFQHNPLKLEKEDFDQIEAELFEFYSYLMSYAVDEKKARTPYNNQERLDLIETSTLAVDMVSDAVLKGDLEFFIDQLPQNEPLPTTRLTLSIQEQKLVGYRELIRSIISVSRNHLSRDDLFTLYDYCVDKVPQSPNKFTSFLRHHNIRMSVVWDGKKSVRGVTVNWDLPPKTIKKAQDLLG